MLLRSLSRPKIAAAFLVMSVTFSPAMAQQRVPQVRTPSDRAIFAVDSPSMPRLPAPDRPRPAEHSLLDFRYRPYDGGRASVAAHPAYEIAGAVAGGTYTFGHSGARRIGH